MPTPALGAGPLLSVRVSVQTWGCAGKGTARGANPGGMSTAQRLGLGPWGPHNRCLPPPPRQQDRQESSHPLGDVALMG